MKLSEFKNYINELENLEFLLPSGEKIPSHFHITEVGEVSKHFIDCGGTIRNESVVNFQFWTAQDYDHRLAVEKLKNIINISEEKLELKDSEIEVEYQNETIGKYDIMFNGKSFVLQNKKTDCLAKDNCGVPNEKPKVKLSAINSSSCCAPNSSCC